MRSRAAADGNVHDTVTPTGDTTKNLHAATVTQWQTLTGLLSGDGKLGTDM
jgi:hypothetical protein